MYRVIILLFVIFGGSKLVAQPYFDLLNIQYQKSPDASISGKNKNPFQTDYFTAGLNIPVKLFKKDVLLINPGFDWNRLSFIKSGYMDVDLFSLTMAVSYVKQWKNEKWKTAFVSVNKINSDLDNITIKHYQPGGAVLMIYERNDKIKYKAGLYYNAEFFGAFVLPLIGLDWKITNRLMLHGIVPRNLVLEYKLSPLVYTGITWRAVTSSFRFKSENSNDYFKIEENQLQLFADIYVAKNFVFNISAGHSFLRSYSLRSELQRKTGFDADLTVNEGLLFKAGFFYRIRLDDKKSNPQ